MSGEEARSCVGEVRNAALSATPGGVVDEIEILVPAGGRALVVSDLHLSGPEHRDGGEAVADIGRAIDASDEPGVLVLAGDILELLAGTNPEPAAILDAHPDFVQAVRRFAASEGRCVVYLVGNHDGRLAWDTTAAGLVAESLQARLAFALDLVLETGEGLRRVRVEHGNRFDPANAFTDPRNPLDAPLGHHIVREVLPSLPAADREWLAGMAFLSDPISFPTFVASRLAYRRLVRHLRWLAVPVLLGLALKAPLTVALLSRTGLAVWPHRLLILGFAVLADVVLVSAAVFAAARQAWEAVAATVAAKRGAAQNEAPRDEARALIARGWAGLITGHTHHPELTPVVDGFYGNTGCSMTVVDERPTHTGLPPVFLPSRMTSWLELEAATVLHVRLVYGRQARPGATRLERVAARAPATPDGPPAVVASFPHGPAWPGVENEAVRLSRTRTRAALALGAAGLVDIVSASTPPLAQRLRGLRTIMPFGVPRVAAGLVALAGVGLLLLARGVRRGGRRAWGMALALLVGSAVLHVVKGIDVEEAAFALAAAAYLWARRRAFQAPGEPQAIRTTLRILAGSVVGAVAVGTAVIELFSEHQRLPVGRALLAAAGRLVAITAVELPDRVDDFLTPVLACVGFGSVMVAGWLLFRPVVPKRRANGASRARARDLVERYGGDSLAYFALRDDKQFFFWADSLVAYAVIGSVCLVSPDPIGPASERAATWAAFHRFATEHGWSVAVMGASEEWLPVYRAAGLHDLYVGDEAIVDCQRFSLQGGPAKGLRQAVNRIARNGYRSEFFDPAHLDPALRAALTALMAESRRGNVERGFSMTLSRIFDPADRGLLLSVVFGPDGRPAAFCQWAPAPGIDGYSLDLMRRSKGEHPNGLLDFLVVETIRHLAGRGMRGLALNFATMRAVLAGETGSGPAQRAERWLLRQLSDSMQIESLWKYNAKFDPEWKPRYAVYGSSDEMAAAALAVAKAESFWELPVIGRFLVPASTKTGERSAEPVAVPGADVQADPAQTAGG